MSTECPVTAQGNCKYCGAYVQSSAGCDCRRVQQQTNAIPMSTPTILPWHNQVGNALSFDYGIPASRAANIVAAHDPHAAQHQETVRLLERAMGNLTLWNDNDPKGTAHFVPQTIAAIRAHLASLKPAAPTQNAER